MKTIVRIFYMVLFAVSLLACKRLNPFADDQLLAEVNDQKLYTHDVATIFTPGISPEDSVKILQSYVDQWVKNQLKVEEAERIFESSQEDIDKKVEEYRSSLLTHKIDQHYVDLQIDTLFTQKELEEYYAKNRQDFILDKTILKARVVKFPDDYRQAAKLKELLLSSREDAYQDLLEICTKNNFELIEANNWTDFSVFISFLPSQQDKNLDFLLNTEKVNEIKDKKTTYYVRVLAYRKAGDYTPLESISDVIKRVIFNQRKQQIIRNHEDSLYRDALARKSIIVNVNK